MSPRGRRGRTRENHPMTDTSWVAVKRGSTLCLTSRITSAPPRPPAPLPAWRRSEAQGCTAFGKLMSVANRDKRAVVLIARDEDQVARTDES